MRKLFTLFIAVMLTAGVLAQAPEKMSYQAVIRSTGGTLVTSTQIGMEINIRQASPTGTVVYTETQTPTTNANGLVSIEIGSGVGFSTINWGASTYFIETKTALVAPLTTYTITGVSQLLSVPYALNAKTADNGITTAQATAITNNTSAISTLQSEQTTQNTAIALNTAKVGVTPGTATGQMQYWNGSQWLTVSAGKEGQMLSFVGGVPTWVTTAGPTDVYNPNTSKIWMDRNLGASQVATSSTDAASYGDIYQWGRGTDGHQIRTSGTTATLSTTDLPGHGNFITINTGNYDWRSPQNSNLWQGVSGTNNPCPSGYRLPTEVELEAERLSWSSNNSAGAFGSPLKLPVAGYRGYSSGSLYNVGSSGGYWSSTVGGKNASSLYFNSSNVSMSSDFRAYGFSVRCLKD